MKLLFSEATPDYQAYCFPYVIWGFPEAGETPADMMAAGFLPGTRQLDRFYLCRQVRVRLGRFSASSENRRILRKNSELICRIVPRAEYEYTEEKRAVYLDYCAKRLGEAYGPGRLDGLFGSRLLTHCLTVTEPGGREVGCATLYVEAGRSALYYMAFYDLEMLERKVGMFMMTSAVKLLAEGGLEFLHLGTCYSQSALYKTQFAGCEFFNGFRWSGNMEELKGLLRRQENARKHYLEDGPALGAFYGETAAELAVRYGW
jgi:hypothetical protein